MKPNTREELDRYVNGLNDAADRWISVPIPRRRELLARCMDAMLEVSEAMVQAACEAKGIPSGSPAQGEEWLGGPMTIMRNLRLLRLTLEEVQARGQPRLSPREVSRRPDGQLMVDVFPRDRYDSLLFSGFSGQIWVEPGVEEQELLSTLAMPYRQPPSDQEGKVALVLGAGNVASIGPMDVLYKLFCENQVCLLKMNPVNEYLGPFVAQGLGPLVEEGVLQVAYGGAEQGEYLVAHPGIHEVHITGSDRVHDIIVWGAPGEEQRRNREANTPRIQKRITSELGCVTPVIVVPGAWSEKELDFQAANIATMVANNASFNCNAAKVLVTSAAWPQRHELLRRVEGVLSSLPPRKAYYPGSDQKYKLFLDSHPEARQLVERAAGTLPWTTIFGVDPEAGQDVVFRQEAWCAVLAETALPEAEPDAFLARATKFANETLWGTLSCAVVIHPATRAALGDTFEDRLADLRYGSVAVNHWAALSYGICTTTWGAFPCHTLQDIGSGIGTVHNTLMIHRPQRSVIHGPFVVSPTPPWFVTHRRGAEVGRNLTRFEHRPSVWRLLPTAYSALRG